MSEDEPPTDHLIASQLFERKMWRLVYQGAVAVIIVGGLLGTWFYVALSFHLRLTGEANLGGLNFSVAIGVSSPTRVELLEELTPFVYSLAVALVLCCRRLHRDGVSVSLALSQDPWLLAPDRQDATAAHSHLARVGELYSNFCFARR